MPAYVTVKVPPDAADTLRRLTLDLSSQMGRRLSLGAVLGAACMYSGAHLAELAELITATPNAPGEQS